MTTTIGTGKCLRGTITIAWLSILLTQVFGCHNPDTQEDTGKAVALVTVVHPQRGLIESTTQLPAISLYLQKNSIAASVGSYIKSVKIRLGDHVQKGQLLYVLETKERHAMTYDTLNLKDYGIISIKAPNAGIISNIAVQQGGSFISEGSALCTIAATTSVAFQINVPYELKRNIKTGERCQIILPDSSRLTATIESPLTQVDPSAQAQPYLARLSSSAFLPENLIGSAQIITHQESDAQLVPRQCVLSDELMHHFWVMQAISDSVAIKVPIQPGEKNDSLIEITAPTFLPTDRILSSGNYGLSDTAAIKIQ
jgi:biotin carboxyl carrier protein